ncbi:MAG: hypothetical protein ACXWRE_15705 [Pseudobdellovibrionaceae bacterium]
MKLMDSYFLKILGMVAFTMPLALEVSAEMTMTHVQIQNCASQGDSCIRVKAPKAQVSSVRPIYFMKDIEIEIESKKTTYQHTYSQGYLDFDNNQLVLQSIDKKQTLTEEVYNLTTLQKQVFITR